MLIAKEYETQYKKFCEDMDCPEFTEATDKQRYVLIQYKASIKDYFFASFDDVEELKVYMSDELLYEWTPLAVFDRKEQKTIKIKMVPVFEGEE